MRARLRCNSITLTVFVWTALVTGIAVHAYFHPTTHTVYDIYAPAARNWWAGQDLYVRGSDYFRYSPLIAISFTPFALLPDEWGGLLWKVFSSLFFALGLHAWVRHVLPANLSRNEKTILFLLALPVSLHSMYIGQANLMMLAAMLLSLAAAVEGRWNWSAGWLAWATLIKGYPLALGFLLAGLYPRRFPARFAIALGVCLALPFASQRPPIVAMQYASWFSHLRDSTTIMRERSRSLDYLLATCAQPISPRAFTMIGMATGAIVFALTMLGPWARLADREKLRHVFSLFAVWLVLFAPAIEACTYAVMAPVIGWALVDAFRRRTGWGARLVLIASLTLMGPIVTDAFGPAIRRYANEHALQPVGGVLFLGYLVSRAWDARSTAWLRSLFPGMPAWRPVMIGGSFTEQPPIAKELHR